jgi:hypothetical protein
MAVTLIIKEWLGSFCCRRILDSDCDADSKVSLFNPLENCLLFGKL